MSLTLFPEPGPRIFAAPAGRPLADAVAEGVLARLAAVGAGPEALVDVEVLVSTQRAMRALRSAFARACGGVVLGPKMRAIAEAGLDPAADSGAGDGAAGPVPAAIAPLDRLTTLTWLVRALLRQAPDLAAPAAAPGLAADLGHLLDEAHAAGVSPEALRRLAPEDHAEHWEKTSRFLAILAEAWPAHLAEVGRLDPAARRALLVARLEERWAVEPPRGPILAIGSPTDPLAIRLMARIAAAPQGAVIVPGADPDLPDDVAAALAGGRCPEHPHAAFVALLEAAGLRAGDARLWAPDATRASAARRRLFAQAMRPAPVTDAWRAAVDTIAAEADAACAGLTLLEAPGPREEALAIALVLREALETPGRTAALATPDRTLARRVAGELLRWGVNADDSSGRPLALTPPGVFFRLTLRAADPKATPLDLVALLGHPLARAGHARGLHLRLRRRLERQALRGAPPLRGLGAILAHAKEAIAESAARAATETDAAAVADVAGAPISADAAEDAVLDWLDAIERALEPLIAALAAPETPLAALFAAHLAAADAMAAGPTEGAEPAADLDPDAASAAASPLYQKAAGETLATFARRFAAAAAEFGPISGADYTALLAQAIGLEAVREPYGRHARVAILGPLEARMLSADVVVLGGLTEGLWPRVPTPGPWLSREMRAAVGLPPLEATVGLSANDFLQAAMAPTVVLSRTLKADGAPTSPSRWLLRLETLLAGAAPEALATLRARAAPWLALADRLDRPERARAPAPRPAPKPPIAARPRKLSVTEVETLIRDPYAIYARRVLRLEPLPALEEGYDARDRGELLHRVMERMIAAEMASPELAAGDLAAAAARFDALADATLAAVAAEPTRHAIWRARLDRIRDTLLAEEAARARDARPIALEARGEMTLPTALGAVTLTAKADRIDRLIEGGAAIYDYKTGAPPSKAQVKAFAKQLPLQAAMLAAGGFEAAPALPAERFGYLRLGGGGGKLAVEIAADRGEAEELAREAVDGLTRLLSAYADLAVGYPARARPQTLGHAGDFDHLARRGEWTDGEDGDGA